MRGIIIENGNLVVKGRTITIGAVEQQVCEHLVVAFAGEYKHEPMLGGGVKNSISGNPGSFWEGDVKNQLKYCKVEANQIKIVGDDIIIELK